jgi:hypothetical protein
MTKQSRVNSIIIIDQDENLAPIVQFLDSIPKRGDSGNCVNWIEVQLKSAPLREDYIWTYVSSKEFEGEVDLYPISEVFSVGHCVNRCAYPSILDGEFLIDSVLSLGNLLN